VIWCCGSGPSRWPLKYIEPRSSCRGTRCSAWLLNFVERQFRSIEHRRGLGSTHDPRIHRVPAHRPRSLSELKTQLVLARTIGYLADADLSKSDLLSDEVGRLLNAVIRGLRRRQMAVV